MIREMRTEDVEDVYSIISRSFDQYYDPSVLYYFISQWPQGQIVACDYAGRPIGMLTSTRLQNGAARIMMIAVDEHHRGKGIGQEMLNRFRMNAFISGIRSLTLEVRPTNTGAIRFYKRNGFSEAGSMENYYQDGGPGIRMNGPVKLNN